LLSAAWAIGLGFVVGCARRFSWARSRPGEDFAGVEFDDGYGRVVGDGQDAFAGVDAADAEVVHATGGAQAHLAVGVDGVIAESVVAGGVGSGRFGLG